VNVLGTYELTYRATNALGAVGTAARTVVVTDTWPPILTLLGDNPLMIALGTPFVDPGATATDLCGGDFTGSVISNITVNTALPGIYTNIYAVTDASGNSASTNRRVLVVGSPVFTGGAVAAVGQFRLQAIGMTGLTYTLQTSTNLMNWVDDTNIIAGPGGVIEGLMDISPNSPARFYRLRWP
jgi:hypothetical protein